ncbi:MAG: hypothetical protein ABI614_04210 [Planctomycetota bacterium]
MSARDNTFIDAYGLDLNDELSATHAEPSRPQAAAVQQPAQVDAAPQREQTYRFDAAARRRTLRGPHFDMRRVVSQTSDETSAWDAFATSVIDVGAAWASPSIVQPSFDEKPVAVRQSRAAKPVKASDMAKVAEIIEETAETRSQEVEVVAPVVAPVVTPVATPAEVTVADVAEVVSREQATAVDNTEPAATTPSPNVAPAERFAPVWEVDRFVWPEDIEQLFKAQTEYFDYAGKKLVAASREGLNILAVTSTRSGEGSTTLALCLARAAAGAGAKVGLLDGNLMRSELGEKLGVDFASGWQTAALEQPLAEAAITGLEEGITLFPSAAGPVADIESLGDVRVGPIFQAAAANVDLLIIDAGQSDLGDNVQTLDAAIVVRDIRRTSEAETLAVATALRNCGVRAVGIAENFGTAQAKRAAA